jgi:hypothetical protein
MIIDYPIEKFNKVKKELSENWNSINSDYIFWTPSTSNIIGYNLYDWDDIRFPHTNDLINHIKKNRYVYSIILYIYNPYTRTTFHTDPSKFRYVYPIVSNDLCFNYEIKTNTSQAEMDKKLFAIDNIDKLNEFNTEFLQNGNSVSNWKENECYLIGTNIHAHLNYSNELRIALVIDNRETLI